MTSSSNRWDDKTLFAPSDLAIGAASQKLPLSQIHCRSSKFCVCTQSKCVCLHQFVPQSETQSGIVTFTLSDLIIVWPYEWIMHHGHFEGAWLSSKELVENKLQLGCPSPHLRHATKVNLMTLLLSCYCRTALPQR